MIDVVDRQLEPLTVDVDLDLVVDDTFEDALEVAALTGGGDEGTIDRFGPNGSAWVVSFGSRVAGRLQSGYVYTYAFVMLIGLTAAVTWAITR